MFERNNTAITQLREAADNLLSCFADSKIFAFYGEMGSGKTTFIREICKSLRTDDTVTSPTFAIVNEYHSFVNGPIYHFDFYRVKNLEEVFDLGYEDYFFSGHYCLIEWPEKISGILPDHFVEVTIKEDGQETRRITARYVK